MESVSIMEIPLQLRTAVENLAAGYSQAKLKTAAESLTDRYRNESGNGKRLVTKDEEAVAYSAVRMPATFGAVRTALGQTAEIFGSDIDSVIDVGSGTGASAWAFFDCFGYLPVFTGYEREETMIKTGKQLASDTDVDGVKWVKADFTTVDFKEKADLVIASYSLNELDEGTRARVLDNIWNAADKLLLIIEPGTPEGFRQIRKARDYLISKGGYVAAPCPHNGNCPIDGDDWCHFTCRVPRTKLHKFLKGGDVPYEDEKFSYLAVSRTECMTGRSRVLRHPLIESGKITLKLCGPDGIATKIVTKKQGEIFKKARKSDCGDTF